MKSKKWIWILVLIGGIAVLLGGAFLTYQLLTPDIPSQSLSSTHSESSEASETSSYGSASAPDFTVYDADGNKVSLSDYRGKPVLLNFWASWCGPCQAEMPDLQEAYESCDGRIAFLMVNVTDGIRETQETAEAFLKTTDYSFPVFYDLDASASAAYGVTSYPTTYFIGPDGKILSGCIGMMTSETVQSAMDLLENSITGSQD